MKDVTIVATKHSYPQALTYTCTSSFPPPPPPPPPHTHTRTHTYIRASSYGGPLGSCSLHTAQLHHFTIRSLHKPATSQTDRFQILHNQLSLCSHVGLAAACYKMIVYMHGARHSTQSTLAEPGGSKAPRGGKASSSALPTSTLSCDSGGYPLSLLEVHLGGMLACIQQIVIGSSMLSKLTVYSRVLS